MTPRKYGLTLLHGDFIWAYHVEPRPTGAAFCVPAYDWRADALDSFHYALHMKALALGAKRFSTISELYWIEQNGSIP